MADKRSVVQAYHEEMIQTFVVLKAARRVAAMRWDPNRGEAFEDALKWLDSELVDLDELRASQQASATEGEKK